MDNKIVKVAPEEVERFAQIITSLPDEAAKCAFYSDPPGQRLMPADVGQYPRINHPAAIDFFFFVCSQNFGQWYGNYRGFVERLFGMIDGAAYSGFDLICLMAMRALEKDEEFFSPIKLAAMKPTAFAQLMSDDNGPIIYPDWEDRYVTATALGNFFCRSYSNFNCPKQIVDWANNDKGEEYRLRNFTDSLGDVPGFNCDLLQRHGLMLAMILSTRPEHFLHVTTHSKEWRPMIDPALMRLCLRMGLVSFTSVGSRQSNVERRWVSLEMDDAVRGGAYNAICQIAKLSGKSIIFIDGVMRDAVSHCHESARPDCANCPFNKVCDRQTELFQPVVSLTRY